MKTKFREEKAEQQNGGMSEVLMQCCTTRIAQLFFKVCYRCLYWD